MTNMKRNALGLSKVFLFGKISINVKIVSVGEIICHKNRKT